MAVNKSQSLSQRNRRKLREAKARRAAAESVTNLGGASWKLVEFDMRPYAHKVQNSNYEELKAVTTPPKKKDLPKTLRGDKLRKMLAERFRSPAV